ncbi:dephospho-CoA kinase [Dyadobacter sandarakinus]|uniref:Dephospho-CoA kinase n=1 Tax=Dyadobacter sandarakinus TaxID=2747268 RepID=A0ABX7I8F0_9BACT|nr:dephospho-CoA kinase [Dyadobacter sandarakinus]QRR01822.1 dephospho-CoA kinase [Dyadobacter sandarakinus]
MSKPLQIGVTGGIGSGKSIICRLFSCLDIPVYGADARAKWLTNHHPGIREQVTALLGTAAYDMSGRYDTAYVASKVFKDEVLLQKLNSIIHPVVMEDTAQWVRANAAYPYLIKEAAIMNKAGDGNTLDYVIVVEAPENLRISRILMRDRRSEEEIRAIIRRQVSDDQRRNMADFIIKNDDVTALIPQVMHLHRYFRSKT